MSGYDASEHIGKPHAQLAAGVAAREKTHKPPPGEPLMQGGSPIGPRPKMRGNPYPTSGGSARSPGRQAEMPKLSRVKDAGP